MSGDRHSTLYPVDPVLVNPNSQDQTGAAAYVGYAPGSLACVPPAIPDVITLVPDHLINICQNSVAIRLDHIDCRLSIAGICF